MGIIIYLILHMQMLRYSGVNKVNKAMLQN